jgi:uncharacterized protein Yka (UPF0111/DUF47 family)
MRLLPVEHGFFDYFEKHVEASIEGARLFIELLDELDNAGPKAKRIKEVEHEADVITHQTVEMLHTTFITPFDRDEIFRLTSRMDDILDAIEAASERLWLYEIKVATPESKSLAKILHRATMQLKPAIQGLRHVKREREAILKACVDVNRLENEGDAVLRQSLAKLFKENTDALTVMKWKEVYEFLEHATDRCEDVANIIEGVVLENA